MRASVHRKLHVPVCMNARLAYGEMPFIFPPNASLIITGSSDFDYMIILLQFHLIVEVQIHSHEVSVLSVSHDH